MEARHLNRSAELPGASKQSPKNPVHYNVILVGKSGAGKSASGNTILGRTAFNATTPEFPKERVTFEGVTLDVYDTPGFFDPERSNEDIMEKLQPLLQLDPSVPLVFLLVMKADRFTPEEKQTVEMIEDWVPEWLFQNIWILFTRGDELEREGLSIEEFIKDTEELSKVMKSFKDRYHIFNNRKQDPDQVRRLIEKLKTRPPHLAPELRSLRRTTPPDPERDPLRFVLLGKTGVGKSAAGNIILREKKFRAEMSTSSITEVCERQEAEVEGRNVSVVDTPGLFDLAVEIGRSVYLSSPGPHAFLYVLPINVTFTKQEEEVIQKLEMIYGEEMRKYTIILFTHGDQLEGESLDKLIEQNESLTRLVDHCGGRYHLFNNKDLRNRVQVTQLLEKIDSMLDQNGGTCYSNEMFEDAQRCKLEEEERRKQEEEDRKQRDEEQKQEELERVKEEIRIEMEMERFCSETEDRVKKEIKRLHDQIKYRFREENFTKFLQRQKMLLLIGAAIAAGVGVGGGGIGSFLNTSNTSNTYLNKRGITGNLLAGVGLLVGAVVGAVLATTIRQKFVDKIENTIMHELQKMNEDTKKTIMEEVKKKREDKEKTLMKTEREIETKVSQEIEEERKEIEKKNKEQMEKVRKIKNEGEEMKRNGDKKMKEEVKKMKKERDENIKKLLDREREGEIKEEREKMNNEKKRRIREEMKSVIEKEMENMKKEMDKRIEVELGNVEKMIKERIEEEMKFRLF